MADGFSASCCEPGSLGKIMEELLFLASLYISYHFLGSSLQALYQILGRPLAFLVTPGIKEWLHS